MDTSSYYLAEQQIADQTRSTRAAQRHALTPRRPRQQSGRRRTARGLRRLAEVIDPEG